MRRDTIIGNLTQSQLITKSEKNELKAAGSVRVFLTTLVSIYEQKTRDYFEDSLPLVKAQLKKDGIGSLNLVSLEKTIDCAHAIFLNFDKFSALSSLKRLLAESSPELLPSLGLTMEQDESLQQIVKEIFIRYVARQRLMLAVDYDSLASLCLEVEAPHLFPTYLLRALRIEQQLSNIIKNGLSRERSSTTSDLLTVQVQSSPELVYECLSNIIIYVGQQIQNLSPSNDLRERYFNHLNSDESAVEFAQAVAGGYIEEMCLSEKQLAVMQSNNAILQSKISSICLPAFASLGLPVEIDPSTLVTNAHEIEAAIKENKKNMESFDERARKAKEEAYSQIDEWRKNVPTRPFQIGFQIGFQV